MVYHQDMMVSLSIMSDKPMYLDTHRASTCQNPSSCFFFIRMLGNTCTKAFPGQGAGQDVSISISGSLRRWINMLTHTQIKAHARMILWQIMAEWQCVRQSCLRMSNSTYARWSDYMPVHVHLLEIYVCCVCVCQYVSLSSFINTP